MITKRKTRAREYLRVSHDTSGRARSTEEQHDDHVRDAEAQGWTLGAPYVDNDVSASRYSTKVRKGYDQLLSDLVKDRFAAEILLLWESSRGSRKVSEWVRLLELCEARGVRLHVHTHNRTYDPSNARDRRTLLEDSVDSEYESAKGSERMRRAAAANAANGRPQGRAPYGYVRRYDERTRQLTSQDPHPTEAAVIREMYARLHGGDTLRAIAVDFTARGIRTRTGKEFTGTHLRDMALSAVYAAYRAHKADGHGRLRTLDEVELVEGTWPALVDRSVWYAVRAKLLNPKRRTSPDTENARGHLLTFVACCDVCGGPMGPTRRDGHAQLQCHNAGHVKLSEEPLDDLVTKVVLAYLQRPDVAEFLAQGTVDDPELTRVRTELAAARSELRELREALAGGRLSVATAAVAEPGIAARIEDLERQEAELAAPPGLGALLGTGKNVRRRWKSMPMSARKDVLRILLTPRYIGELRVTRSPVTGHRCPPEDRVRWRRDEDA